MPAPIPETIKVGHLTYAVDCSEDGIERACKAEGLPSGQAWGHTDHRALVITLDPSSGDQNNRSILWHEIHHAVRHATGAEIDHLPDGWDEREESMIRMFSTPTLGVLLDNPLLVAYLTEA